MQRGTRALTGVGLVVGGALLGMLALTVLPWYRSSLGGLLLDGSTASDIRKSISFIQGQADRSAEVRRLFDVGISPVFFGGLGFVLLLLAAAAGFAGAGVSERTGRFAAAAAGVVSLAGLVLLSVTIRYVAIKPTRVSGGANITSPPSYLDFVTGSGIGAWAMVLAYLAIGVGALLAAGSREELRELLRDDDDDDPGPVHPGLDDRDEADRPDDDHDDDRDDDRDSGRDTAGTGSSVRRAERGPADEVW